jgi:hypothetical protein
MTTPTKPLAVRHLEDKIAVISAQLGSAPTSLTPVINGDKRTAEVGFATVDDLVNWATWLHWPWTSRNRGGRHAAAAYGEWVGFSVTFTADEPINPAPNAE